MITWEIKSLKKLNRKERYLEEKELLINEKLDITFNEI